MLGPLTRRDYAGRLDDVDMAHARVEKGARPFAFEPYAMIVHRGGLYFAGRSAHHGAVRTLALDGVSEVERRRGETFEYPADFDPRAVVGHAFGIIRGERVRVRVWFSAKVARFVKRRAPHATQTIDERDDGSIEWSREVEGTQEIASWVLGGIGMTWDGSGIAWVGSEVPSAGIGIAWDGSKVPRHAVGMMGHRVEVTRSVARGLLWRGG